MKNIRLTDFTEDDRQNIQEVQRLMREKTAAKALLKVCATYPELLKEAHFLERQLNLAIEQLNSERRMLETFRELMRINESTGALKQVNRLPFYKYGQND